MGEKKTKHKIDFTSLNTGFLSPANKEVRNEKMKKTKHLHVIQIQVHVCAKAHQNVLACKTQSSSCLPILNSSWRK